MKFLISENNSMVFFAFVVKWMLARFAGCRQLWNHDLKLKNKKSAIGV